MTNSVTNPQVLVVDDEADIRELLKMTLSRMDLQVVEAPTLEAARQLLGKQYFEVCLTDMRLPDGNGIELVEYMQQRFPEVPVAMITAYGNMEAAIAALKAGAFDFVSKPVDLTVLRDLVSTALKISRQVPKTQAMPQRYLLGNSKIMEALRSKIAKLARSQAPVYISGASGVGKELVARLIHDQGPRFNMPFVPVNCGAIPTELMESEFFGYKKGSFTGANSDKEGLFQAAHGGTLFLDEVADLPLNMQVKLLRAIQEKTVRPVGAAKEIPVDVRILSATHKDLHELVNNGSFRQDLFYRINVIELPVPSLRERPEDIPILVNHILNQLASQQGVPTPDLTPDCLQALQEYSFPGNIRELENILERAFTLCEKHVIKLGDLNLPKVMEESPAKTIKEEKAESSDQQLETYLDSVEKERIVTVLDKHHWNRTTAAKELGITLRALRYRLKKLGLE